jgi:hypothetical protein
MFETTHIPHDAIVPSTQDSQSSYLCLTGLLAVSCEHSYSGMASMIPGQPSLLSDTLQYGKSHNAESSQLYQSPGEIARKTENELCLKSTATEEEDQASEPTNWQHISSTEVKPHEEFKDVKQKRKSGRRHGRLKPEIAKHAREMRHLRACLPCVIMKITVGWYRKFGFVQD